MGSRRLRSWIFTLGVGLGMIAPAQHAWANTAPIAQNDAATTRESTAVSINVLANDSDPDGDSIRLVFGNPVITAAANGTTERLSDTTIRYTPNAGFSGTDTFRYRIADGQLTHSAVVTITVNANHQPVARNDTATTASGQALVIQVTANDSDPDDDPVQLVVNPILTPPTNGTATRVSKTSIRYTPNAGFSGADTFRYRITDGFPGSVHSAVVTVTVTPGNRPPVARNDVATTRESTAVSINVLANDSDPDGDPIRLVLGNPVITAPSNGTTLRLSDTTIRYTPNAGFSGTDSFRYRIADGQLTHSAVVTITVNANRQPVAVNDATTTRENQPVVINVTANDSDPDGDPVQLVINAILTAPTHGTATRLSDSTIRYAPNVGFSGTDTFRYRITDGFPGSVHSAVVTVTVNANRQPVALPDRQATPLDTPVSINVTANDSDPDGDPVQLVTNAILTAPTHGTATRLSDSTIRYAPNVGFSGTDTFRYRITDGFPGSVHSALVTVRVDNQQPRAFPDSGSIHAGNPITLDVVANDTDADGDPLVLVPNPILTPPTNGAAVRVSDREIRYTPNAGFVGSDTYRYRITDDWGAFHSAIVTIDVTNQAPVARDDAAATQVDAAVVVNTRTNDSDPDGDPFSVTRITREPSNGSTRILDNRNVRYTPRAGFTGTDTFDYQIADSLGATDVGRVTIDVTSIPEPEVTAVERDPVRRGQTKVLIVRGSNLQNAAVEIATLPLEEGDPPRSYPTAELVTINTAGNRMEVRVDATNPGVDGFYNIAIETPGGMTAAQFRIVGPEPVIDVWTPSEPIAGRVHVLQVMGENLGGANVVPMDSGVRILEIDNSDAKSLSGLMFVSSSVPPGQIDLRIDGTGGSTMLPMDLRPDIQFATQPTQELAIRNAAPGQSTPKILMQDPISAHSPEDLYALLGVDPGDELPAGVSKADLSAANRGGFCFTFGAVRQLSFSAILFSLLDDVGDPITREAINALVPGDRLDFTSLTLAVTGFIRFEFYFRLCDNGFTDLRFCITGGIAVMVPAVGGWSTNFSFCLGFNDRQVLAGSGRLNDNTYTSNNACVQANDLETPGFIGGERQGELRVNCCEDATISLQSSGVVFDRPFTVQGPVIETELECAPLPQVDLTVKEVSFLDDLSIKRDTVGSANVINDPVWSDPDLDGLPLVEDNAVAYVRGRSVRALVKLVADAPPLEPVTVRVRATSTAGITLESGDITLDSVETLVEVRSTQPLANRTQRYAPLDLDWTYTTDGGEFLQAGRTRHLFYVTLAQPITGGRRNLTVSALELGIGAGGVVDQQSAITRTWSQFAGPANVRTREGRPLFYYPQGSGFSACQTNAVALLTSGDGAGQCGSFAHLLMDAFAVNGIPSEFTTIRQTGGLSFIVRNWSFGTPSFPGTPFPYRLLLQNEGGIGAQGMVPLPPGGVFGDLTSLSGVPGQNSPTPSEKAFFQHFIVRAAVSPLIPYYDPSYGQTFQNATDFQNRSIQGFYQCAPAAGRFNCALRQPSGTEIQFTP